MAVFRAFLDPGLYFRHVENTVIMLHQQRKVAELVRNCWFTAREEVHKIEERNVRIGHLVNETTVKK